MKCPKCQFKQKYKSGMVCGGCSYRFALNPKEQYSITDMAFKLTLDQLSGAGQYYFTHDQLYAKLYRLLVKKQKLGLFTLSCLGMILIAIGSAILVGLLQLEMWAPAVLAALVIVFIIWLHKKPVKVPANIPLKHINTYKAVHPIDNLVDGTRFCKMAADGFDTEFLYYAPERILIVEHDATADMLILNRFHFENKALVVSAGKYPRPAFDACQRFLSAHPDLPVCLVHDCSEFGIQMESRLLTDPKWHLKEEHIIDLGLHPKDVEGLKTPMWIPEDIKGTSQNESIRMAGDSKEYLDRHFRVPLGVAGPTAFLGTMGLAMTLGVALLSEELLAEQRASAIGGSSAGTGFG